MPYGREREREREREKERERAGGLVLLLAPHEFPDTIKKTCGPRLSAEDVIGEGDLPRGEVCLQGVPSPCLQ